MEELMKRTQRIQATKSQRAALTAATFFIIFMLLFQAGGAIAGMKSPPPEKIKAIIIGDRVVDIAYNLGVLPEAMSVRGGLWPMARKLKTASQILGCPRCIVMKKQTVPKACKKFGVTRLIIEKSDPYCLYKPKVKPENIVPIMAGKEVTIEYVDFANGLDQAVRQTARLVGRESKAEKVIEKYRRELAAARAKLPAHKSGKGVIIFSGTYQPSTGKSMLRVEAPGGYADRFLLEPLGCVNVGNCFKPSNGKAQKGHYPVRKKKGGMVLDPVISSNPDIIVMTGDAFAVQKAFADYQAGNPALAQIKAIRTLSLYALPAYVDSGVLEYPATLTKWATALSE
jgi:hypothetical protein